MAIKAPQAAHFVNRGIVISLFDASFV